MLFSAGVVGALFTSGIGSAAPAPPPTTTGTCTLTPQLRGVTVNQGLNSYLALARGKETLVRPYLSLPTCAWGYGAIQVTGGSVQVRNGSTAVGPAVAPTPAVATPFPQLPTFATAPMQDGPADLKFLVPGSVLAPTSTTGRWTATFQISIRYQVKAAAADPYGQEQTVTFTTTRTIEQRTRNIGVMFVPLGVPLDGPSSTALLNGLTAFSNTFPYQDGTTPLGTPPGVRLGDLGGTQGGVRYTINPGVINVGTLPYCGTAANFDAFKGTLATFRQAWNTGNAAAITSGTVSAADKVVGVVNEANSLGGSCLSGYSSVTSHEAWIRVLAGQAGSLFGMEFCHTFTCVPPSRSDGAYHSIQVYADMVSGDVNRGYSVIDRTLVLRPRTVMRLVNTADDPWGNSTAFLERDDYAFMLCQMGGFAARNTPCTTSGSAGTLAGAAAGPTFVMSGTTNDTQAGTEIVNAYFETGVAQTTPLQGSAYSLVQKNGNTTLRTDGVRVSKESSVHDGEHGVEETIGAFSVAFPFNTNATTIEFRKGSLVLWVFNKTDPPVVTGFSVTTESSEPIITFRSAKRTQPTRRRKAGSVNAAPATPAGRIAASTLPGSVRPFGFFAALGTTAAAQQATYVVNTGTDPQSPDGVCDASECTLREALTLANENAGLETIEFSTAGVDVESELPTITDPVIIDGTQADETPALIELNGGGTSGATAGLRVGTGGGGTTIRRLAIVRFPGPGIVLQAGSNVVERNHIGVPLSGTGSGLGNSDGIRIESSDNTIGGSGAGAGNVIAHNNESGIAVWSGTGNRILGNAVFDNFRLGIDLFGCDVPEGELICAAGPSVTPNDENDADVTGGNKRQNFPIVQTATSSDSGTVVTGSLDGDVPNGSYRLEFFHNGACDSSGHGEGENILGVATSTSDGDGNIVFEESFAPEVPVGQFVTATATDPNGNTSEFSACREATGAGGGGDPPTFTVSSANDANDGACTVLHCSLREAITAANGTDGAQTISFAIGLGQQTISPTSTLPAITEDVTIDGTTQPGFSGTPIIELAGNLTPATTSGLTVTGGAATIKGLAINRFPWHGIFVQSTAATGTTIQGNYLGTDPSGTLDRGNGREGIRIESDSAIVGGTTAALRNVASGNSGHGILLFGSANSLVQGNYAGTNAAGTAGIPNGIDGIIVDGGSNNTIGGTASGAGNLASGNTNQGIAIAAVQPNFTTTTGNVVQGNKVGTDVTGTSAIPNGVGGSTSAGDGVRVHNGSNTTIGGTTAGAANIIAHNRKGVAIFADAGLTATGNRVSANQIHSNTDLGIDLARNGLTSNDIGTTNDLDTGPNNLQNFPVIDSVRNGAIEGRLASEGGKTYDIEFFANTVCDANGHGEGARYLGTTTVTTNAAANGSFTAPAPSVVAGEWVTATATDPDDNTSEFSACKQAVVTAPPTEPGPVLVDITGTDDDPGTVANPKVRGTLYGRCGNVNYPLVVDALPTAISGNQVQFHIELDTEPLCADGNGNVTFTFRMSDLWQQSVENQQSRQTAPSGPESPTVAILSPDEGEVIRENAGVTLVGSAFDGEDEAIPPTALQWTVTCLSGCSGFADVSGTGTQLDVPTEIPGTYRATLTVTGFGTTAERSVTYIVAADSENDGLIDSAQACLPPDERGPSDDGDDDGIWNGNDPQPCQAQPGGVPYQADGDFNPDPLPLQSRSADPSVTFYVTLPYRDLRQVDISTVRIESIGGKPASIPATAWTVASTGVATAKFDRTAVINFVNTNGLQNKTVVIEVSGRSTSQGWSFFASDSTTMRN